MPQNMDDPDLETPVVEELSMSIEETNRLRISLGLKPLNESKGAQKDQIAAQNFANEKKRLNKRNERRAVLERIAKEQNVAKLTAKLDGKGLGEDSDDEDNNDSYAWAMKHKKATEQRKKEAEKKARELAEMEEEMLAQEYTSAHLKGLRVGHAMSDLKDDILVLADKGVLDEDEAEDELVSVSIADKERARKNMENKKKQTGYKAYDDDDPFGGKKSLLSQYDDEIDGPVKVGFVLSEQGTAADTKEKEESEIREEIAKSLNAT
ncbi:hypothetical protein HDV05_000394, partial [Chytridiales sp. JEL 0842]